MSQIPIGVIVVGIVGVGLTTKFMGTISKHPVAVNSARAKMVCIGPLVLVYGLANTGVPA